MGFWIMVFSPSITCCFSWWDSIPIHEKNCEYCGTCFYEQWADPVTHPCWHLQVLWVVCLSCFMWLNTIKGLVLGLGIVHKFSVPIPWVRYRFLNHTFFDNNFMKSVVTRLHSLKNFGFIFSACWHLYRLKASSPAQRNKIYPTQ